MEEFHEKIINKQELKFYKIVEKEGIAPKIIEVIKLKFSDKKYLLKTLKYPYTLREYCELLSTDYTTEETNLILRPYYQQVNNIIDQLHNMGILHGDFHSDNIVVNPDDNTVKIIDFGRTRFIKDIDLSEFGGIVDFMNVHHKNPIRTIDQLLNLEKRMYRVSLHI